MIVVIVIVAVVIVIGAIAIAALVGDFGGGSQADFTININSTHLTQSVDYACYVDGKLVNSGTIDPGYYMIVSYTYHWSSGITTVVTISATSSGGGFGSQTDSEDVVVSDGGAYTVNLYI